MKKTKFSRIFESLIYFILLTIPLISVFARVIYTQSNNNAKDSYSNYFVKSIVEINSVSNYIDGNTYYVNNINLQVNDTWQQYAIRVLYKSIDINVYDVFGFDTSLDVVGFEATVYNTNGGYFCRPFYLDSDNILQTGAQLWSRTSQSLKSFTFVANRNLSTSSIYWGITGTTQVTGFITVPDTIDNAFDYGIQKTIDDFGVGNINFLNWFGTMFSNNNDLLYINFVNMYLNYALWVSVGYLLYYFLNWFIRFVREILDNLIYKETKN